jgi:hypothetical protein
MADARQHELMKVWEMIDGLAQAMTVLHHPALLCMPDGRTRLLWRSREDSMGESKG